MRKKYCILPLLLLMISSFFLTGAGLLTPNAVTLDVKETPAYHSYPLDEIGKDLKGNTRQLETKYKNKCISTIGTVTSVSDDGKTMTIREGSYSVEIYAKDADASAQISALKSGDKVKVFGSGSMPLIGKVVSIIADAVKKTDDTADNTRYDFVSGKSFSTAFSESRSLGSGKFRYLIPSEWAGVEKELTNIEGFQYSLNELAAGFKTEPEQVYIFYFDNEKYLKSLNDRTDTTGIEKAIIKNILENESIPAVGFPDRKIKADPGIEFSYYDTGFIDSTRKDHNLEFVFTPVGTDGIGCMLYVFNESNHKEDIIYVMRTMEVH